MMTLTLSNSQTSSINLSLFLQTIQDDIFSLGMVLSYIFFDTFPEKSPDDFEEWEDQFISIINFFKSSYNLLSEVETNFVLKCISKDPKLRYKSILEAKREIQAR